MAGQSPDVAFVGLGHCSKQQMPEFLVRHRRLVGPEPVREVRRVGRGGRAMAAPGTERPSSTNEGFSMKPMTVALREDVV
jgi:hypothetical protein